ncbi:MULTISPECIES: hypothetical protein [unclassified Embleya]
MTHTTRIAVPDIADRNAPESVLARYVDVTCDLAGVDGPPTPSRRTAR